MSKVNFYGFDGWDRKNQEEVVSRPMTWCEMESRPMACHANNISLSNIDSLTSITAAEDASSISSNLSALADRIDCLKAEDVQYKGQPLDKVLDALLETKNVNWGWRFSRKDFATLAVG